MFKKPEALRLADALVRFRLDVTLADAAAELCRLHANFEAAQETCAAQYEELRRLHGLCEEMLEVLRIQQRGDGYIKRGSATDRRIADLIEQATGEKDGQKTRSPAAG